MTTLYNYFTVQSTEPMWLVCDEWGQPDNAEWITQWNRGTEDWDVVSEGEEDWDTAMEEEAKALATEQLTTDIAKARAEALATAAEAKTKKTAVAPGQAKTLATAAEQAKTEQFEANADNCYLGTAAAIAKAKATVEEVTEISRSIATQTPEHSACECPFCPMA